MKASLAALLLSFSTATFAGPTNLVTNGSFESNGVAPGSWTIKTALDGWQVGGYGAEVRNNVAGSAHDGSNYLELDTTANSWIRQQINTVMGAAYQLSFYYSAREFTNQDTNAIDVFWNGLNIAHQAWDSQSAGNSWAKVNLVVTALTSQSTLEFRATGRSDSYGGSLDNVMLLSQPPVATASAVSEPGTLACLLVGLIGAGLVGRQRKRSDARVR